MTDEATALIEDKARKRIERDLNDLRFVLSYAEGRRLLWSILWQSGLFNSPLGSTDAATNANVGKADLGRGIYNCVMRARPEAFVQMMNDSESERIKDEAEIRKAVEEA